MNLFAVLKLLRPTQWLKNLMLFFPSFLGGELLLPGILARGLVPFVSFCFAASSTYVLNDILDRERDKSHHRKSKRPIPSGKVSLTEAVIL
jgi:decaprenyl-phosphate phosphoribosyltransferase